MKGSISIWIWIIGGVLAALLVFSMAYMYLVSISNQAVEQRFLEQYANLRAEINDLCWGFSGTYRDYRIELPEHVEVMYLTNDTETIVIDIDQKVRDKEMSIGSNLCMKFEERTMRCLVLDCEASMPYLGTPDPDESLFAFVNQLLTGYPVYEYEMNMTKIEGEVIIQTGG